MSTNREIFLRLFTPAERAILSRRLPEMMTPKDLASLDLQALLAQKGFGPTGIDKLEAVAALYTAWVNGSIAYDPAIIAAPEDVARIMSPRLKYLDHEEFHALLLNNSGRILSDHMISHGVVNASLVHPREVFKCAVRHTAASLILVHNHPSGIREASKEDHNITKQLIAAGKLMDIPVQDHVIICNDSYISFAESGWM